MAPWAAALHAPVRCWCRVRARAYLGTGHASRTFGQDRLKRRSIEQGQSTCSRDSALLHAAQPRGWATHPRSLRGQSTGHNLGAASHLSDAKRVLLLRSHIVWARERAMRADVDPLLRRPQMRRTMLRFLSVLTIGVGSLVASPQAAMADGPECAQDASSMCSPPPNYVTCSASCSNTSTGYLLECNYRAFECNDQ